MSKYLHYFLTDEAFNKTYYSGYTYHEPWASWTDETDGVKYNKTDDEKRHEYEELLQTPLTFEILEDGTLWFKKQQGVSPTNQIQYKKNDGDWTTITAQTGDSAPSIQVYSGDTVSFRGNNNKYTNGGLSFRDSFSGTCIFDIRGNIMSLIRSENYSGLTELAQTTTDYCFSGLFSGTKIVNAKHMLLPAISLSRNCYEGLFSGCSYLVTSPELPATELRYACYSNMFEGCSNLIEAPKLPATSMKSYCYCDMFSGCKNLKNAPELPAMELSENCYYRMFYGCAGLIDGPELPAEIVPAQCYARMFYGCRKINYIKCLATSLQSDSCEYWLRDVSSQGTFVKNQSMSSWTTGDGGIPTGWTVQNA